jgi:very-long-chain (3R)-3-hydroxyacyl-CoA dehydratase
MMLTNYLSPSRYTYSMLSVIGTSYAALTWLSQTLWMPIYPLCVLAEGKRPVVFLTDISY